MNEPKAEVLLVDRDGAFRAGLREALERAGHAVREAETGAKALALLAARPAQVAVCELSPGDMDGLELMRRAKAAQPGIEFVMTGEKVPPSGAVEAMRQGAYHLLQKPVEGEMLCLIVAAIAQTQVVLQNTKEQLLQSSKLASLGELAAGVAHELNNPLTSVIGFTHWLLKADNLTAEQREDLERIFKESKRCSQIVQNMLQFARRKPAQAEPVALEGLVHDSLELFRCTCVGIAIEPKVEQPGLQVTGDRPQLQQAILQILGNAKDALAGRKSPKIEVRVAKDGGRALIEIKDNGCGIPAAAVARIFDPFFSTKPQGGGAGLGLSTAYGIVRQHGGAIEVSSVEGQGTSMRVAIPLVAVPAQ
jgi:signal transduction histidine kinase